MRKNILLFIIVAASGMNLFAQKTVDYYLDEGKKIKLIKGENIATVRPKEWQARFYNLDEGVVGKTVEGTIEVYELPGYGALQLSYRRFYDKKNPEWTAPARAIVLWKKIPNGWLRSRVVSLHENPKKP